jgi:hypothetical protein
MAIHLCVVFSSASPGSAFMDWPVPICLSKRTLAWFGTEYTKQTISDVSAVSKETGDYYFSRKRAQCPVSKFTFSVIIYRDTLCSTLYDRRTISSHLDSCRKIFVCLTLKPFDRCSITRRKATTPNQLASGYIAADASPKLTP